MKSLSVGFIGLCHLHPKSYMPVFRAAKGFEVVAVAEANPSVLASFAADFPVRTYADWRVMLDNEKLDLAVLFLPHYQCPEAAVACAGHGVNILAEKPMAASSEGLRCMIAAAAKAGVLLSTPYVWRYHAVARMMKQYVSRRHVGPDRGLRRTLRRRPSAPLHRRQRPVDADQEHERRRPHVQPRRPLDRSLPLAAG